MGRYSTSIKGSLYPLCPLGFNSLSLSPVLTGLILLYRPKFNVCKLTSCIRNIPRTDHSPWFIPGGYTTLQGGCFRKTLYGKQRIGVLLSDK